MSVFSWLCQSEWPHASVTELPKNVVLVVPKDRGAEPEILGPVLGYRD